MKHSAVALLATFLLLLSACGTTDSAEVSATGGIETTPGAFVDGAGSAEAVPASGDAEAGSNGGSSDSGVGGDPAEDDKNDATEGQDEAPQLASGGGATLQSVVLATNPEPDPAENSAQFEAIINVVGAPGSEMPGEYSLRMAGAYDLSRDASRMSIDMSDLLQMATESPDSESDFGFMAAFLADEIEMVTIGEQAWIKWGLLTMFTGAGDKWLETSAADTGDMTADIGVEGAMLPTELLDVWAETPGSVEDLGVETVRGAEATHYRFIFDADELAAITSDAEWRQMEEDLGVDIVGLVVLDVWLDEDGLLHRYVLDLNDPEDEEVLAVSFTFEIWDHGNDVGIQAPAAEDVITEDELTFGFGGDDAFEGFDEFQELSEDFES